jgi:uncharacterized membrane protein
MFFHVPVAALGIAGYALLALLAWVRRRGLLLLASLVALGFALYLSHVEKDILEVWCLYCVISQGIIAILTLCSLGWMVAFERSKMHSNRPAHNPPED